MKSYILYNVCVVGTTLVLASIYTLLYNVILKKRKATLFTPLRVIAVILVAALSLTVAGNILYINYDEHKLANYYYPNKVYITCVHENDVASYASLFSQYAEADYIPGYSRSVRQYNDVKYTYFLSDYPEEHIQPSFVIFAEYTGDFVPEDDMFAFEWTSITVKWMNKGIEQTNVCSIGSYYSTKLMVIGDYADSTDALSVQTCFRTHGELPWHDSETIDIPLDVRHYLPLEKTG